MPFINMMIYSGMMPCFLDIVHGIKPLRPTRAKTKKRIEWMDRNMGLCVPMLANRTMANDSMDMTNGSVQYFEDDDVSLTCIL